MSWYSQLTTLIQTQTLCHYGLDDCDNDDDTAAAADDDDDDLDNKYSYHDSIFFRLFQLFTHCL